MRLESQVGSTEQVTFNSVANNAGNKFNSRPLAEMREIAYGAFALQPKSGVAQQLPPGIIHSLQGKTQLTLSAPAKRAPEVRQAVEAWLALGGIGGRTRRAFGAVASDPPWSVAELTEWLNRATAAARTLSLVPTLCGARWELTERDFESGTEAMKFGLSALQSFRQGVNVGRNPPSPEAAAEHKPAGRSRWPEADCIRRLTRRADQRHARPLSNIDKFPRAAFGMPIIFHFQSRQDPEDSTLRPRNYERMASPLLIRPVRVGQTFKCLAVAIAVPDAASQPAVLEGAGPGSAPKLVETRLTSEEARNVRAPLAGKLDPLVGFLEFFHEKGK